VNDACSKHVGCGCINERPDVSKSKKMEITGSADLSNVLRECQLWVEGDTYQFDRFRRRNWQRGDENVVLGDG